MPPHGHGGSNNWGFEPSFVGATKNGGYTRCLDILPFHWTSTAAPLSTTIASGTGLLAATNNGFVPQFKWTATGTTTETMTAAIGIPEDFAQDDARLKLRLLVISSLVTLTNSTTLAATLQTWTHGAAVKTAIATLVTRRWNTAPTAATGFNVQSTPLGTPTATGTSTITIPTTTDLSTSATVPYLLEFDFTPAATTARTNYPKAGDAGFLRLIGVAAPGTDATDTLTILRASLLTTCHAGPYRLTDRT